MHTTLHFCSGSDDQNEGDARQKGYCDWAIVETGDGQHYQVTFETPGGLASLLSRSASNGRPWLAFEPGLIIVEEPFVDVMRRAVEHAWSEGYFKRLRPMTPEELKDFWRGVG